MKQAKILVVDDEPDMLEVCQDILKPLNVKVVVEDKSAKAANRISNEDFDLAILDLKMPGINGVELLKLAKEVNPNILILIFTGFPTVETAVETLKLGAFDYITKPFTPDNLRAVVKRALEQKLLKDENIFLTRQIEGSYKFDEIIGKTKEIIRIFETIMQIANTDTDVLILGESGTGKELVARSIHKRSKRNKNRFVPVDCGAIPENLMENELFGHEKGAYTGAISSSIGLVEYADKGTLFLDEVCDMPLSLQAKLLRCIQERQTRRIGGKELINTDIRIVAATNKDVELEVNEKRFREDFYYRINVVKLTLPPLRKRKEDIFLLASFFLNRYCKEWGKNIIGIEPEVLEVFEQYSWPGNIRELQNIIKRAVVLTNGNKISLEDIPEEIVAKSGEKETSNEKEGFFKLRESEIRKFEKKYFSDLLAKHRGYIPKALLEANIPKSTFYYYLKECGLKSNDYK